MPPGKPTFTLLKCTVQQLLVHSECATIIAVNFRTFSSPQKRKSVPISSHSPFSSPLQPLATTNLLSVSMDFPILDTSHKWSHTICGVLCLASLTYVFKVHPCFSSHHTPFTKILKCIMKYFFNIYLFILAVPGLSCGMRVL